MRRERALTPRTDWFRILAQLQYQGYNNFRVAEHLGIPDGTVRGWKDGAEPRHCDGHRLLELWAAITGHDPNERPIA